MFQTIGRAYFRDYLLVDSALANKTIDKTTLEAAKRLRSLVDHQSLVFLDHKRIKMLCDAVEFRITTAALNCGLNFRTPRELAVISGAGIAGLAASFELRARGFNVVIAEGRGDFSRFNVINLSVETQVFLEKFNLLKKFEAFVAARIKEHRYVVIGKTNARRLALSDVSELQLDKSLPFEPENFINLFDQDGIYSVPIGVLQTFLAENALQAGVHIFGNVTLDILDRTPAGGVSQVQITGAERQILQPDLFFIAEGAHSTTVSRVGMRTRVVENECTDENWIFANLTYPGEETFVVSIIDASKENLRMANVIFNGRSHVVNVAVTSEKVLSEKSIREQILETVQQAFLLEKIDSEPAQLLTTVKHPTHVANRTAVDFSIDNVFRIGDAAGHSSPLAGLGGTLALTLVPRTISQLLDDRERQPEHMHHNFRLFSEAYTSRWNEKSQKIKKFCISILDKEHTPTGRM